VAGHEAAGDAQLDLAQGLGVDAPVEQGVVADVVEPRVLAPRAEALPQLPRDDLLGHLRLAVAAGTAVDHAAHADPALAHRERDARGVGARMAGGALDADAVGA